LYERGEGRSSTSSMSKIINRTDRRKNRMDSGARAIEVDENPHS
jgi:hypothetical protein